jgi:hypothetical protein
VDAVLRVLYPEPQLELNRGLAEGHDQRVRRRYSQDALRVARGLAHQRERLVEIGVVRHTHPHFQPHTITLVRPVDHLMGNDVLVPTKPAARALWPLRSAITFVRSIGVEGDGPPANRKPSLPMTLGGAVDREMTVRKRLPAGRRWIRTISPWREGAGYIAEGELRGDRKAIREFPP